MIPRQDPLAPPAVLFASGGARTQVAADTLDAHRLALRLGATGIETGLLSTADGVPVVRSDGRLGGLRRRRVAETAAADLPSEVITLDAFYTEFGGDIDLLVHVADPAVVDAAVATATRHRALDRLWLAAADHDVLVAWRERSELVRLVDTTPMAAMAEGMERHAARLRQLRIDALLAPQPDWTGGRTALLHRFGRRCIAAGAQHERVARLALHIGADAVTSAYPDLLADAAAAIAAPDAPQLLDE